MLLLGMRDYETECCKAW